MLKKRLKWQFSQIIKLNINLAYHSGVAVQAIRRREKVRMPQFKDILVEGVKMKINKIFMKKEQR